MGPQICFILNLYLRMNEIILGLKWSINSIFCVNLHTTKTLMLVSYFVTEESEDLALPVGLGPNWGSSTLEVDAGFVADFTLPLFSACYLPIFFFFFCSNQIVIFLIMFFFIAYFIVLFSYFCSHSFYFFLFTVVAA